jgi:hypothetical protein
MRSTDASLETIERNYIKKTLNPAFRKCAIVLLLIHGNSVVVSVVETLGIKSTTPESSSAKQISDNEVAVKQTRERILLSLSSLLTVQ